MADKLEPVSDYSDPLEANLQRLRSITTSLRLLAFYIFALTLMNTASLIQSFLPFTLLPPYIIEGLSVSIFTITLTMIAFYDFRRRGGNAIFEEISDEIQWNIMKKETGETKSDTAPVFSVRRPAPPLEVRIVLRTYVQTINLPLISSENAPGIYAVFNVILTISTFVLLIIRAHSRLF